VRVHEQQTSIHRHRVAAYDARVTAPIDDLPRQEAATRRFRLGQPRAFQFSPAGDRVAFVRSASGRDPVGSLWLAEAVGGSLLERSVADAHAILRPDADLPAAERARRERLRESTSGITAFSTDRALEVAAFSLDGDLWAVDLMSPEPAPRHLAHSGPVVDPRVSPDGVHVAYVTDGALALSRTDATGEPVVLARPEHEHASWGLADFVAAEELDRVRGLWWLATSDRILAEHVDESGVEVRWIGDPALPANEPRPHRYPSAGTANPVARLFVLDLAGHAVDLDWDRAAFPYLATVHPDDDGGAVVSVLSRDQRRMAVLGLAPGADRLVLLREREQAPWITMHPGVPQRLPDGRLAEIVADVDADTDRLVIDDVVVSPPGLQVAALVSAGADRLVVTASDDPCDQHVWSYADGQWTALTAAPGVHSTAASANALVIASATLDTPVTAYRAVLATAEGPLETLAEQPVVTPRPHLARVGERRLSTAVLWPSGHVPGSRRLPVVLAPYGGPHHARVQNAAGAFVGDQWLADQGFAVVVIDGAGTPGRGPAWEFDVAGDVAESVLADQVAGLHALAEEHADLDLDRVGITGWSFGGFLAALAVLDRPDVFHVAVAGAPVTDWRLYDTAYTERYLGLPQEHPDVYDRHSLLRRAASLTRPLMIIHGLADDNVLAANSLQLSGELLAAGRPHTVLPLSGVTHFTPQVEVAANLPRLEAAFLAEHLRPTTRPS
jgi:dipeptidyl-peptidase-4